MKPPIGGCDHLMRGYSRWPWSSHQLSALSRDVKLFRLKALRRSGRSLVINARKRGNGIALESGASIGSSNPGHAIGGRHFTRGQVT
ncbi:hypothetical protein QF000_006209 [Paraburkholderia atlantica]